MVGWACVEPVRPCPSVHWNVLRRKAGEKTVTRKAGRNCWIDRKKQKKRNSANDRTRVIDKSID
jgi:hypothetical protein